MQGRRLGRRRPRCETRGEAARVKVSREDQTYLTCGLMFSYGGSLESSAVALQSPYMVISPSTWKRSFPSRKVLKRATFSGKLQEKAVRCPGLAEVKHSRWRPRLSARLLSGQRQQRLMP
jgi:hypothetical protein